MRMGTNQVSTVLPFYSVYLCLPVSHPDIYNSTTYRNYIQVEGWKIQCNNPTLTHERYPMPGLFITLEGADGTGKTTQLALLTQALTIFLLSSPPTTQRESSG